MVTRIIVIKNLEKFIGQDLAELAHEHYITTFKDGKQNKGWKGLTLEHLAGLSNDNKQAPNGLGFEVNGFLQAQRRLDSKRNDGDNNDKCSKFD